MQKTAEVAHPVHPLIAERWSPRAFSDAAVEPEKVASLLEAARWAPSCFNEQPWRFLVAMRSDTEAFERIAGTLVDANGWARSASVLVLTAARRAFTRDESPNRHALHDLGLAAGNLVLQAQSLGLVTHQMAGFDPERARRDCAVPEGFEPATVIAIGYPGDPETLAEPLRERELAPRTRKPLETLAFGGRWGEPLA